MLFLLKDLYYRLKKEEINKAHIILERIKIDTILQNISKVCWKNNIGYKVIIKTGNSLTLELFGYSETVVLRYHKIDMVSKEELDFFLGLVDRSNADRGVYITIGSFQLERRFSLKSWKLKKDVLLIDGITFVKGQIGFGKAAESLRENKINLFKYLPA